MAIPDIGDAGIVVIAAGYILDKVFGFLKTNPSNDKFAQILDKLTIICGDIKQSTTDARDDCRLIKEKVNGTHSNVSTLTTHFGEACREMTQNTRMLDKLHDRLDKYLENPRKA